MRFTNMLPFDWKKFGFISNGCNGLKAAGADRIPGPIRIMSVSELKNFQGFHRSCSCHRGNSSTNKQQFALQSKHSSSHPRNSPRYPSETKGANIPAYSEIHRRVAASDRDVVLFDAAAFGGDDGLCGPRCPMCRLRCDVCVLRRRATILRGEGIQERPETLSAMQGEETGRGWAATN
jgi:hypothetical protein